MIKQKIFCVSLAIAVVAEMIFFDAKTNPPAVAGVISTKKDIDKVNKQILNNKFMYEGKILIPVSYEGEEQKVFYDDGFELYAYSSYDEATRQYYKAYFQTFNNREPCVKAITPKLTAQGDKMFYGATHSDE